jgi:hypothetical protein
VSAERKLPRGVCQTCQRVISGRYFGTPLATKRPMKVELLSHKNPATGRLCNGSRKLVLAITETVEDEHHDR